MPSPNWPRTLRIATATLLCGTIFSTSSFAQDGSEEIVVTASRIKGSVETEIAPIEQIGEEEIASLGADSVTDILTAIAPQSGSGRGRGGGMPIILLNGQRISGFRELRDIPSEAIKKVEVFPEEVAIKFGYRPDQRVVNFILKDNFAAANISVEHRIPENGGFSTQEVESGLTRIGTNTRTNITAIYEHQSRLTEDERDINLSPDTFIYDGDIRQFRSILPATDRFEVNANWNRAFSPQSGLSINASLRVDDSSSLQGLPSASFTVPAGSPFNQSGNDEIVSRYFDTPRALEQKGETFTKILGASFNSRIGGWRWNLTGNYTHVANNVRSTRNADFSDIAAGIADGSLDPLADDLGRDLQFLSPDLSKNDNENYNFTNVLSGNLLQLSTGPVQLTFRGGYGHQSLDSRSVRASGTSTAALRRANYNGSVSIDIPLSKRGYGPLSFLGDISVEGNYGLTDFSDFGQLTEYGVGLRWSPIEGLNLLASWIGDENAPDIAQLGNPVLVTPNVTFFDFTRNTTAFIDVISGGNSALLGEKRRDFKLSANLSPKAVNGLNLQVEYFRNRSSNVTRSFPLLTPEIEAAFADRVVRNANGQLISVDQRPVNFDREDSRHIRWGFNYSGTLGKEPGRNGGQGAAGNRDGRQAQRPGGGRPGFGPGGRGPGSRWQVSLYHLWRFEDEILIREGVAPLDRLNGSATDFLGGSPRHELELSGGAFKNGLGVRVTGNYRAATRVDGDTLTGGSDLRFGDLATVNLRFFINLENRGKLAEKVPFFKGSRIAVGIDNILDDYVRVRDENGVRPVRYQQGYLNPRGRYFELDFRKRF